VPFATGAAFQPSSTRPAGTRGRRSRVKSLDDPVATSEPPKLRGRRETVGNGPLHWARA
jgi:hypothetical protein